MRQIAIKLPLFDLLPYQIPHVVGLFNILSVVRSQRLYAVAGMALDEAGMPSERIKKAHIAMPRI